MGCPWWFIFQGTFQGSDRYSLHLFLNDCFTMLTILTGKADYQLDKLWMG
jgi:hypothetical protein